MQPLFRDQDCRERRHNGGSCVNEPISPRSRGQPASAPRPRYRNGTPAAVHARALQGGQTTWVLLGKRASGCLVAGVILAGCGGGDTSPESAQCSLLSGAAIERQTGLSANDGVLVEHEESGDGTWCLYEVNGARIELQLQPGNRVTFDARRDAARREGAAFVELGDIGDAAFFGSNGIANTTVLVDGNLLVVQSLEAVGEGAQLLTSSVARAAADRCCPG